VHKEVFRFRHWQWNKAIVDEVISLTRPSSDVPIISRSSRMIETMDILVPNTRLTTPVKSFNMSRWTGTPSTPRHKSSRAARRRIRVEREDMLGGRGGTFGRDVEGGRVVAGDSGNGVEDEVEDDGSEQR
jgi:hypothetical protein